MDKNALTELGDERPIWQAVADILQSPDVLRELAAIIEQRDLTIDRYMYEFARTILDRASKMSNDSEFTKDDVWYLADIIEEEVKWSDVALSVDWDSGGPGAGGGSVNILEWNGLYFYYSPDEDPPFFGPLVLSSEEDVLDLVEISTAVTDIVYSGMSSDEIAHRLTIGDASPGDQLRINDELYVVNEEGKLARAEDTEQG